MSAANLVTIGASELQRATVVGYADGVVSMDPPTLQCRDCGATATGPRASYLVTLSGFHFHRCEGREGLRRCPDCLAKAEAECTQATGRRHSA